MSVSSWDPKWLERFATPSGDRTAYERLLHFLERFRDVDRQILTMTLVEGRTQQETAEAVGMTQAGIYFRLETLCGQLGFWFSCPDVGDADDIRRDLAGKVTPKDIEILVHVVDGATYAETGRRLGLDRTRVRERVYRMRVRKEKLPAKYQPYLVPRIAWKHFSTRPKAWVRKTTQPAP